MYRRVKVLNRIQTGANQGFVFHGMGAAMADDDLSMFGCFPVPVACCVGPVVVP